MIITIKTNPRLTPLNRYQLTTVNRGGVEDKYYRLTPVYWYIYGQTTHNR